MKLKQTLSVLAAAAVGFLSVPGIGEAMPVHADTWPEVELSIDSTELTLSELADMDYKVPLYVRLDKTPGLTAIEFGITSDLCSYEVINSSSEAKKIGGEALLATMVSSTESNFTWVIRSDFSTLTEPGPLLLLYVTVPESASVGDRYTIAHSDIGYNDTTACYQYSDPDGGGTFIDYADSHAWTDGTITIVEEHLELADSEITLEAGSQYRISANQENLTYSSSDPDTAVVSKDGVVTALKEGTAVISVINSAYEVAQMQVHVTPRLSLTSSRVALTPGSQYQISANQEGLTYSSDNTDVAVVSKTGLVTALADGTAAIRVSNAAGTTAQLDVTVAAAGDVNGDAQTDLRDVILFQKYLIRVDIENAYFYTGLADLNSDGRSNVIDLTLLKQMLTGA